MKAIVNTAPGALDYQDLPTPTPGAGQVRIRTAACGICATDLVMIAGWERTGFPAIPGHEWSGVVDEVGPGVNPALIGRKCVAENVVSDGGEVGFEHPGGYARYLITESANLQIMPDEFPLPTAALIEPLAVAVRGMNRLGAFDASAPVLIIGDGPIGLLMLMLMVRAGAGNITLAGGRSFRLDLARELGADATLNYHETASDDKVERYAVIIEASGSASAMAGAISSLAHDGKILILGDYKTAHSDFLWNDILLREATLVGSNASAGAWTEAVRIAVEGKMPLAKLITHTIPAARYAEGMDLMNSRRGDVIKIVMEW